MIKLKLVKIINRRCEFVKLGVPLTKGNEGLYTRNVSFPNSLRWLINIYSSTKCFTFPPPQRDSGGRLRELKNKENPELVNPKGSLTGAFN